MTFRWGVRTRTVAASVLGVAAALAVSGIVVILLVGRVETTSIDRALRTEASSVASLVRNGHVPAVLASPNAGAASVQVVSGSGRVVASTSDLIGQGAVLSSATPSGRPRTVASSPLGEGGAWRELSIAVAYRGSTWSVVVGESLAPLAATLRAVAWGLVMGDAAVVLLTALLVAWLARRAWSSVDAIRERVAAIATSASDQRVPVPVSDDEVARLARTMNDMLARLGESEARQRRFVADASHELASPLAAATTELTVGLRHPESTTWDDVARAVLGDLERINMVVADLLVLARADDPSARPREDLVDLDEVVDDVLTRVARLTPVTLDRHELEGGRVRGDREELSRLVRNLVDNAVAHARTTVAVGVATVDQRVELAVGDDGPGIKPDDRDRVFGRFVRTDEGRAREVGGTGLGLAIVASIARAHGATVRVEDGEPGAVIRVTFPAT